MWNFNEEIHVRDCVRGIIVSCCAGVCRVLLETGDSAYAFFGGAQEQTEFFVLWFVCPMMERA